MKLLLERAEKRLEKITDNIFHSRTARMILPLQLNDCIIDSPNI